MPKYDTMRNTRRGLRFDVPVSHEARLRLFVLTVLGTVAALALCPAVSFWFSVGLLVYTYLGYPLLLAAFAASRPKPKEPPPYFPKVSVLIAAHNEEETLARTIRNMLSLDYPEDKLELIVASDASTDGTDSILQSIRDPRVRWLRLPTQGGKTQAQNQTVRLSKGDVIVFSDATTVYDRQAIRLLVRHYADPKVGGVSGRYEYLDPDVSRPAVVGTAVFWRYENLLKLLQSRAGTMTGSSGCIYSVRRSLYTPLPPQSCSDLVEPLMLVRKGYRIVFESRALAFETSCRTISDEFRMRVRVAAHGIDSILENQDLLNVFRHGWVSLQLISHKVLRWMTPLFLLNAWVMSALLATRPGFKAVFIAQTLFYAGSMLLAWAPRRGRWRILGIPFQLCALHAAVLVGVSELISGKVYTIWRPARN